MRESHQFLAPTLSFFIILSFVSPAAAKEAEVRTPGEILAPFEGLPSTEALLELFVNASEWDASHQKVRDSSKEALIKLGPEILPPLLEEYLSSTDLRRRITLDDIVRAIGRPASAPLLEHLKSGDAQARRHAAYLLGDTSYAASLEDPAALGPFKEDRRAARALLKASRSEKDEKVLRSIVGALGKMRNPERVKRISSHLTAPSEPLRLSAAVSLGSIPHVSAAKALLAALGDEAGSVRQAAVLSLSSPSLGRAGFDALLDRIPALPAPSREKLCCLEALARYLGNISSEEGEPAETHRRAAFEKAREWLREHDDEEEWLLRGYLVSVIGQSGVVPGAVELLEEARAGEDQPFVTVRIEQALKKLKSKER